MNSMSGYIEISSKELQPKLLRAIEVIEAIKTCKEKLIKEKGEAKLAAKTKEYQEDFWRKWLKFKMPSKERIAQEAAYKWDMFDDLELECYPFQLSRDCKTLLAITQEVPTVVIDLETFAKIVEYSNL